jgi:hypothetical protein
VSDPIWITEPALKRLVQPLAANLGSREAVHHDDRTWLKGDFFHGVLNAEPLEHAKGIRTKLDAGPEFP